MHDPARDHLAQRGRSALSGCQIEPHIEAVAALPVAVDRAIVEHVGVDGRQSQQGKQRRLMPSIGNSSSGFLIPGDDRVAFSRQLLRTKEHLGSPQNKSIGAIVQRVAQDDLYQLPDENLRQLDIAPHDFQISQFKGAMPYQMIAPGNHHLPVFTRIRICDRSDLRRGYRLPWIAQQATVKLALGRTGFRWRDQFGAGQIHLQEFVRHKQSARGVAIEQMMAASEPEIMLPAQGRIPSRSVARSRCWSAPRSSPTTSTKLKARDGDCAAGRNERNASRIDPPSTLLVTATMTPAG